MSLPVVPLKCAEVTPRGVVLIPIGNAASDPTVWSSTSTGPNGRIELNDLTEAAAAQFEQNATYSATFAKTS